MKILVQSFHSHYVVRDWFWFLWIIFDAELHSQMSFYNCKKWRYQCCDVSAVIVEELDHDKKINSIILNIIAVRLKISLENLILSFNLIINARIKCNAKFSLDQKMIAQQRLKVQCKYKVFVKDYIVRSFMISNYSVVMISTLFLTLFLIYSQLYSWFILDFILDLFSISIISNWV